MTHQSTTLTDYREPPDQPIRQTMRGLAVYLALFAASCGGSSTQPSPTPAPAPDQSAILCTLVGTLPCQIPPPPTPPKPTVPTSATVRGTVTDATSGGVLPGISIALTSGNHAVATDARGQYVVADVPLGPLTVTASATSYITKTVVVTLAGDTTVDVVLSRVAVAPSPAPPATTAIPAHGGVAWDTITIPHEFIVGSPVPSPNIGAMYCCWPFPVLNPGYDFTMSHYPLDVAPSGGNSGAISASEMLLAGIHFAQASTTVTTMTWWRVAYGNETQIWTTWSGTLPHTTMMSYIGHFSWEVNVPGLYYVIFDTEWGSVRLNFVVAP